MSRPLGSTRSYVERGARTAPPLNDPHDPLYGLIPWVQATDAAIRAFPKPEWRWRLSQALNDGARAHNDVFMEYAAWALSERLFRSRADVRAQVVGSWGRR